MWKVSPISNVIHKKYMFFIKVTDNSNENTGFLGPYILEVGCTQTSVTFTDKTSNLLTVQIYKDQHDGDYTTGAKGIYVYEKPDVGPSYCQLDQTEMSTSRRSRNAT